LFTSQRNSTGGPNLLDGQIGHYRLVTLNGTAA